MAVNGKRKGKIGELEWAAFCHAQGYDCRRTAQYCGNTGDASDVVGLEGIHQEVKRVEALNVHEAVAQAVRDSKDSGKSALYPHVEELFAALKEEGYALYIASNGLRAYLEAIVGYFRLDRWVSEVFSIEDIQSLDKGVLVKTVLDKHHISRAAMVGDRLSDIKAAKANGLAAIGCHFDFAKEEELVHADFVIKDLLEIEKIVAAM